LSKGKGDWGRKMAIVVGQVSYLTKVALNGLNRYPHQQEQ